MDNLIKVTNLVLSPTLLGPALETVYMVAGSALAAFLCGFPVGVALILTEKGGLKENRFIFKTLDTTVNVLRSFPFIILMLVLIPFTRAIAGTTVGTTATIIPLSIAAAPFMGRVIYSSLKEVNKGVIEASEAMGSSLFEIIFKVMVPEAMPSLVMGVTLTVINIVSYSAMAGAVGGGGLGDLAVRFGYHRFRGDVLAAAVLMTVLLVQSIQFVGSRIAVRLGRYR